MKSFRSAGSNSDEARVCSGSKHGIPERIYEKDFTSLEAPLMSSADKVCKEFGPRSRQAECLS